MINRMTRAAQMNIDLYEEVEHDTSLSNEALQVVIIVSVAEGLGILLSGLMKGQLVGGVVGGVVAAVLGVAFWYLWSYLVLLVGTKLFNGTADFGEVSRTIAYAYTPNVVKVLAFVPGLGGLVGLVAGIWSLVLGVVAVRQAMDFDTGKAIATVLVAGIIAFVVVAVITMVITLIVMVPLGVAAVVAG